MPVLALTLATVIWIAPVEPSYGPYSRRPSSGSHAIAVSREAMLLAWSEVDPATSQANIHLGLLDHGARSISPIATIPLISATMDAVQPEVTSDGTSFRVTYIEGAQLMAVDVDAAGVPAAARPVQSRENPPPATANWRLVPIYKGCGGPFGLCLVKVGDRYELTWIAGKLHGGFDGGGEPPSPVAVTTANQSVLFAWTTRDTVNWLFTSGEWFSSPASAAIASAPGIACGVKECVIAYGTISGDLHALSFAIDQPSTVRHFVVNASERHEHSAQVHALPGGMFLVSYASDLTYDYSDHRIAGRVVAIGPVKRRAAE